MRFINLYFVGWVVFVFGVLLALWKAGDSSARRAGMDRNRRGDRARHRDHVLRRIGEA
jgi:hypothetical protein